MEDALADSSERQLLDALARAAMHPAGLPLFARGGRGLFALTPAGKQAARQSQDDGLLRVVRRERRGKTVLDLCALTTAGLACLLERDDHYRGVSDQLAAWVDVGSLGDCPLPELFRRLQVHDADLTIGVFHDRLRLLHQGGKIYLHPWTGPLYEMPEPAYALLVGHEIAYYASLRDPPLAALPCNAAIGHEDLP